MDTDNSMVVTRGDRGEERMKKVKGLKHMVSQGWWAHLEHTDVGFLSGTPGTYY